MLHPILIILSVATAHSLSLKTTTPLKGLKVFNSIVDKKDDFIPKTENTPIVWYICGPAVHQPPHMGHARRYINGDIMRRILQDYFGVAVSSIMNINDWDDRIMSRSKREKDVKYYEIAKKYEREFHEDMARLGVLPSSIVTRVTDSMPEIIDSIQDMVSQELAYASHGSVFMDWDAYEKRQSNGCCRLPQEIVDKAASLAEKEEVRSHDGVDVPQRRSRRDFALWKPSETVEPEWPSPWGPGRPGWNLAWSASASDAVTQKLMGSKYANKVYSGGFLPQQKQVKFWIKSGAVNGWQGSVRSALQKYTPRQLRLLCLHHKYSMPIERNGELMHQVLATDRLLGEFYEIIKTKLAQYPKGQQNASPVKLEGDPAASQLQVLLQESKDKVDAALKDDFDTPIAINILVDLALATESLLSNSDNHSISVALVAAEVARYITHMLQIFGVIPDVFVDGAIVVYENGGRTSTEGALAPVLDVVAQFMSVYYDEHSSEKDWFNACHALADGMRGAGIEFDEIPDESGDNYRTEYSWRIVD